MASKGSEPKTSLIASGPILTIAALLATAIVGWSLFWFIASRKADATFTAWIEREAQAGRSWICPERRISGYPLDIEISCANALFQGEILGRKFTGSLRGIRASTPLLRSEALVAELEPPFVAKTSDGAIDAALHWGSLGLELVGRSDALSRVSLIGEQVTLQGAVGDLDQLSGSATNFLAYVVLPPGRQDYAYDFRLAVNDAAFPALDTRFGLQPPVSVTFGGTATQINYANAGKLEDRVEGWRAAGGKIDLKTLRLKSGSSTFEAHGGLDLDAEHRVRGDLDAVISGLEPVLRQLGVDPGIITAGSLVTNLLGQRARGETEGSSGARLPLPVSIADGWLSIGPIRTQVHFSPLY
jgi:hypothetical protein